MTWFDDLENRQRRIELSGDHRAGVHSRRQIRSGLKRWMRINWQILPGTALFAGAMIGILYLFAPRSIFGYLTGAVIASAFWLVYSVFVITSGVGHKLSGIAAEEWTANILRPLHKHGWRIVNHVMLEHCDVDHALVGPGGLFAVDTKFRSDWSASKTNLDGMAKAARYGAEKLAPRLGTKRAAVVPLVAMWGPGLKDDFPDVFDHEGAVFCPGSQLRDFVMGCQDRVSADEVSSALAHLDDYVSKRDYGERELDGPPPRTVQQVTNDLMAVGTSWLVCTVVILGLARINPAGVWAVIGGIAIAAAALLSRRWWPELIRIRQVTTTAAVTGCVFSGFYGALLLATATA